MIVSEVNVVVEGPRDTPPVVAEVSVVSGRQIAVIHNPLGGNRVNIHLFFAILHLLVTQ